MKVCRYYTFEFKFRNDARLPRWKGNLIRGSVGYHLRKLCCSTSQNCKDCEYLFSCPYGYLFKTKSKGIVLRKIEGFTKPYVIKPPIEERERYKSGESFTFSVIIFGDATKFEEHLIEAVMELSKTGLGVRKFRSPLELKRIIVENPFTGKSEIIFENETFYDSSLFIRDFHLDIELDKIMLITFLTPFRLIRKGELITEPKFRDLIVSLLRRYSAIRYQYLGKDLDMNVNNVIKASEEIETIYTNLTQKVFVYKGEEKTFLHGDIAFRGKLNSNLRKLLCFGMLAHVGKMASFGYGWFEVV